MVIVGFLELLEVEQHCYYRMFEVEVAKAGRDFLQLQLSVRNIKLEEGWTLEVVLYLHEGTKGDQ